MADRRQSERTVRRVPVRFRPRGQTTRPRRGYTTNISEGGLFIASGSPYKTGTRLRLEVGDEKEAFALEGRVAHSRQLAAELHALGQSGMGVELLTVSELVGELLGRPPAGEGEESEEAGLHEGVYRLRIGSAEELLRVFQKDVVHGGLFLPTLEPAELGEQIALEVELPLPGDEPIRLIARVVQRIAPEGAADRPNLLAGMGVHFEEPAEAKRAFEEAVEGLGT